MHAATYIWISEMMGAIGFTTGYSIYHLIKAAKQGPLTEKAEA